MPTFAQLQTPFEFEDRSGVMRTLYGCSVVGRFEFFERLQQIEARFRELPNDRSWQQLYEADRRLKFLIDRCLTLNGIELDWVTLDMVEQLLFHRIEDELYEEGWLISLNQPKKPPSAGAKSMTLEEILAAVSTHTSSIKEAIDLAETLPANQLMDLLEARARLIEMSDPVKKKEFNKKEGKRKAAEAFKRMQDKQSGG